MRIYVVLGMHKSGTSILGNALRKLGINMGREAYHDGSESKDFTVLNRRILAGLGASWKKVPHLDAIQMLRERGMFNREINKVIEDNSIGSAWGVKDPRLTLTAPLVLPHIEKRNPDYVIYGCFRKPKYVAKSLKKRNEMPLDQGEALAKEYNRRLFNFLWQWLELDK